jgi:hypothetical protein
MLILTIYKEIRIADNNINRAIIDNYSNKNIKIIFIILTNKKIN